MHMWLRAALVGTFRDLTLRMLMLLGVSQSCTARLSQVWSIEPHQVRACWQASATAQAKAVAKERDDLQALNDQVTLCSCV